MNMNVDINISLEELDVLERVLLAEAAKESKTLEVLEKYWNDDVCEYQRKQIILMNGLLEKLNVAYKKWLEEE